MKKLKYLLMAIGIVFTFCGFLDDSSDLVVYLGETVVISGNYIERIAISKPEIIDVVKVTENEITLIGKEKGESAFVWWDALGEHTTYINVYLEDMDRVKDRVDKILKEMDISGVYTKAVNSESKVFLLGEVCKEIELERIYTALGDLKENVVNLVWLKEDKAIIEISVQILELQKGSDKDLGFDLPNAITLTETTAPTGVLAGVLFPISLWDRTQFSGSLNLLISEGKARILSRPRVACRSGKEAELTVGGEVPVMTTQASGSTTTTGTEVEYKEYGIKLNIRPQVSGTDKIDLVLLIEVSEIGAAETLGNPDSPSAKAYPLTKRAVTTELSLKDNEVLSIGGLIKQKTQEDLEKFPWLADIPILGAFFRSKTVTKGGGSTSRGDTELFITLSPKIIFRGENNEPTLKPPEKSRSNDSLDRYKQSEVPAELQEYTTKVKKMILGDIAYPELAAGTDWEGNLLLSINIGYDGKLRSACVLKSSGYKIFDDEALATVKKLSYPSFSSGISLEEITVEVPVIYQLRK